MQKTLLRIIAAAVLSLAASAPASAQVSPFSVRGTANTAPPADVAPIPAPAPAREEDVMRVDTIVAPEPAAAPEAAPQQADPPAAFAVPAPFDINEDGQAPRIEFPEEEQRTLRPATTASPLANGRGTGPALPVDAITEDERRVLNRLLKQDSDTVRELRAAVEDTEEWLEPVVDRPIVPFRLLRLDGEIDYSSWTFFISAAEAARGGTLSIAFTNSVLVLPEASRLRIFLNGRQIAQTAIDSPDRTKIIALPIAPGLLRSGENALRIEAEMRHRIDCSILATYELWTRIDPRLSGLSFPGGRALLMGINDLPGVGVGTNGATRIRVVQTSPTAIVSVDRMLRAAQAVAVRGRFAQPLVEVVDTSAELTPSPGTVNVLIGTLDQVSRIINTVPSSASLGPITDMIDTPELGPTVVISGPNQRAVDTALSWFDSAAPAGTPPSPIAATPPWLVPDSVRVDGPQTVTLREAGVETINFSGRRFVTNFRVTLPSDFYAAAYGQATLLLDAAYSSEVEPGSRISVSVNGILSTAISFTSNTGEVFDDFPIVLVMRHFRPGINNIEIVADLNTEADEACLPGGTVQARDRFALFSSTALVFPEFARIGQIPNLAAFTTNGFPYPMAETPVRVRVAPSQLDTLGAAGTLLSRVAVSRGTPLATTAVENVAPFGDSGLIVVAPLPEASNVVLEATGAAEVIPASWLQTFPGLVTSGEPVGLDQYDDVLRRLRQQVRQAEVSLDRSTAEPQLPGEFADGGLEQLSETERTRQQWFEELEGDRGLTGLIADGLRSLREAVRIDLSLGPANESSQDIAPIPETATLLFAQSEAPRNSSSAWTLVTAPTASLLSSSMAAVTAREEWTQIGGQFTAYDLQNNSIETVPVTSVSYVATLPLSFTNFRLIAANWFSINDGVYAVALIFVAVILGLVTWLLVSPLGRRS